MSVLPLILFGILSLVAYLTSVLVFLNDFEENKCDMTYMFEYPQYVRLSMYLDPKFYKYGLYAYSEGQLTEKTRAMIFDGIPVLFVPGNKGSYKQVRSMASVALRMALDQRPGYHFDYFTVDLNEEFSGLNGGVLRGQLEFVKHSINRILKLYKRSTNPPKSVILIGHSMGGIIARALLTSLKRDSELIPLVITLATPHLRPPANLDGYMNSFYKRIANLSDIPDVSSVISISGGLNDFLVPSRLGAIHCNNSLHVVTTAVPTVWLPTDHLCILWCKQLVLTLNRALFDSINLKTKQISLNPIQRHLVFHHHLIHNSGINTRYISRYEDTVNIDTRGNWIEYSGRQYSVALPNGSKQPLWYMIRYVDHHLHRYLSVYAIGLKVTEWAFACPAIFVRGHSKICYEGIHLTHMSSFSPSMLHKRKELNIDMHELKMNYPELTHVIIRILPTDEPVVLHVDVHSPSERSIEVSLPGLLSIGRKVLVEETSEAAVRYELNLPQLEHVTQYYNVYVEPMNCSNPEHHATGSIIVPWSHEDNNVFVSEATKYMIRLRLQTSKPKNTNDTARLKLVLDPSCRYKISIESSLIGMLGQFARFYSIFLFPYVAVVILMCLRLQLRTISADGSCSLIFTSLIGGVRPYFILTLVKIISKAMSYSSLSDIFPTSDFTQIANEGMDFFLLPLTLYIIAVGIFWIISITIAATLILCESTAHKCAVKLLARSFTGFTSASDYLLAGLHKLPILVAVGLLLLSFATCGGLSLCLGAGFYYLKLAHMSQDFVEEIAFKFLRAIRRKLIRGKEAKEKTEDDAKTKEVEDKTEASNEEQEKGCKEAESDDEKNETVKTDGEENKTNIIEEGKGDAAKIEPTRTVVEGAVFFHFSVFLLWVLVACMSVPSVLTWAHNFKYAPSLYPDPFLISGVLLPICAIPLWQLDFPIKEKAWYRELSVLIFVLAFTTLMYATLSLYRLQYFLTLAIALLVLHQLLAPLKLPQQELPDLFIFDTYKDKVRAKLE